MGNVESEADKEAASEDGAPRGSNSDAAQGFLPLESYPRARDPNACRAVDTKSGIALDKPTRLGVDALDRGAPLAKPIVNTIVGAAVRIHDNGDPHAKESSSSHGDLEERKSSSSDVLTALASEAPRLAPGANEWHELSETRASPLLVLASAESPRRSSPPASEGKEQVARRPPNFANATLHRTNTPNTVSSQGSTGVAHGRVAHRGPEAEPAGRRLGIPSRARRLLVRSDSAQSREGKSRRRRMIGTYQIVKFLGRGSQGTVLLGEHTGTAERVAIKTIFGGSLIMGSTVVPTKRQGMLRARGGLSGVCKAVSREIALLKKVNHPNIVKLLDVIDLPTDKDIHLVFEYVAGGPLRQLSDNLLMKNSGLPLDEEEARCYFRQLAAAVRYLHFHGIVHRDIKPSNLIIDRERKVLKLTDLGIAVQTSTGKASKVLGNDDALVATTLVVGTPAFLPPEYYMIKRSEEHMQALYLSNEESVCAPGARAAAPPPVQYFPGRAADVWATGVTLFAFIYGGLPHTQSPRRSSGMSTGRFAKFSSSSSSTEPGQPSLSVSTGVSEGSAGNGPPTLKPSPSGLARLTSHKLSRSYKSRREPLSFEEMEERIISNPLRFPGIGLGTSARLRHLLTRMLDKDPRTRLSIDEVCKHDWVCKYEPMPGMSEEQRSSIEPTKADRESALERSPGVLVKIQRKLRSLRSRAHIFGSSVRAPDKSFHEDQRDQLGDDEDVFEDAADPGVVARA